MWSNPPRWLLRSTRGRSNRHWYPPPAQSPCRRLFLPTAYCGVMPLVASGQKSTLPRECSLLAHPALRMLIPAVPRGRAETRGVRDCLVVLQRAALAHDAAELGLGVITVSELEYRKSQTSTG